MVSTPTGLPYPSHHHTEVPQGSQAKVNPRLATWAPVPVIDMQDLERINEIECNFIKSRAEDRRLLKYIDRLSVDHDLERSLTLKIRTYEHRLPNFAPIILDYLTDAILLRVGSIASDIPEWGDRRIERYAVIGIKSFIIDRFEVLSRELAKVNSGYLLSDELIQHKRSAINKMKPHMGYLEKLDTIQLDLFAYDSPFLSPALCTTCPGISPFIKSHPETSTVLIYQVRSAMQDILERRRLLPNFR
jgi:hypothetical protein